MNKAKSFGLAVLAVLQPLFSHADDLKPKVVAATTSTSAIAAGISFAHFRSARAIRTNSPTVIFDRLGGPATPREIGMAIKTGDEVRVTYEVPVKHARREAWINEIEWRISGQEESAELERKAAHQALYGKKGAPDFEKAVEARNSQKIWEERISQSKSELNSINAMHPAFALKKHIMRQASKGAVREFVEGVLTQGGKLVEVAVVPESALKTIDKTKAIATVSAAVAGANAVGAALMYYLGPSNRRIHSARSSDRLTGSGAGGGASIAAPPPTRRDLADEAR